MLKRQIKRPFSQEEFKSIFSRVPRLCVDLVIVSEKGVLLTLRKAHGWVGQWHLPGGMVYFREPIKKAVKRIANTELGCNITIDKFLGYIEFPSELTERGFGYSVSLPFLCSMKAEDIVLDDQSEKAQYFKIIPNNTIIEQREFLTTNTIVQRYLAGEPGHVRNLTDKIRT